MRCRQHGGGQLCQRGARPTIHPGRKLVFHTICAIITRNLPTANIDGCVSVLGQIHFAARHVPKSKGSFGNLCEAQTETCKGVLLIVQMDDVAAKTAS